MKKIAIIGGGITGLSAAMRLQKLAETNPELDFVLIESDNRLGGAIVTERLDGFLAEGGPDSFLSDRPGIWQLVKDLGIEDELLPSNENNQKTYIYWNGDLHPLPEGLVLMVPTKLGGLAQTRLISWRGKFRMILEPFITRGKEDDESLASFVRRRLGVEALDRLAEPLISGIHGADPETLSVKSAFPMFAEMEREYGSLIRGMLARRKKMAAFKKSTAIKTTYFMSFRNGMGELVEKVKSALDSSKIKQDAKVTGLARIDGRYSIELSNGSSIAADGVVLTTSSYIAAGLLRSHNDRLAGLLEEIKYSSAATVTLGYRKQQIGRPLDGFGLVIPKAAGRKILANTWSSVKFDNRAPEDAVTLRVFIGGPHLQESLNNDSDESLIRTAHEEIAEILSINGGPEVSRIFKWMRRMPQYTLGHSSRLSQIDSICEKGFPGLVLAGNAYRGIGVGDCIGQGYAAADKLAGSAANPDS